MPKRGLLAEPPHRVVINETVCEGCGDCGVKSNCLSVLPLDTEFGEKRRIHDPSCNRDYTCLEGDCPSFVTITPKRSRGRPSPRNRPPPPPGRLPEPSVPPVGDRYGIYFTRIGGTGVVTASRIIAAAAQAAGFVTGGLDQTGLSQMAGAVVSHLHLAAARVGSATVSDGGADRYLSGDILQAAAARHLAKIHDRTVAVVDRRLTPTAAMLQSDLAAPDAAALEPAITQRAGRAVFVDARRIAESVFADHLLANVVLLGAAFGECADGEGHGVTHFMDDFDQDLAAKLIPVWLARGLMASTLLDVEDLVGVVDGVLRAGASASVPSVAVLPRQPQLEI
jgi:indolepyruvate ferredoxin oxidoreductase